MSETHPGKSKGLAPVGLRVPAIPLSLDFHPLKDLLAVGTIGGDVQIYDYGRKSEVLQNSAEHTLPCTAPSQSFAHHTKSCRTVRFSPDGRLLYSASKDKSLRSSDLETVKTVHSYQKISAAPINCMEVISANLVVIGDDNGTIQIVDHRTSGEIMNFKENDDFISDFALSSNKKTLLATSGDGTLSAFSLSRQKLIMQSELFDSELNCLAVVKDGRKVVCGTTEGVLNIFNWAEWGNISDRFPGHESSIDNLLAVSDDVIVTGSADGKIRAVHVLPNRFLGEIGSHSQEMPVESMALSRDSRWLASGSHDNTVKFWPVGFLDDLPTPETRKRKAKSSDKSRKLSRREDLQEGAVHSNDFFAGFAEPGSEQNAQDDSDNDSVDEEGVDSDSTDRS